MSDRLRPDASPERDHVTPADLLSDAPGESVDPATIRSRTQSPIGPGTCAALRRALRGGVRVRDVAERLDIDAEAHSLRRHYRGRCSHDTDAPPVRWDHFENEWIVDPED